MQLRILLGYVSISSRLHRHDPFRPWVDLCFPLLKENSSYMETAHDSIFWHFERHELRAI